MFDTGVLAGSGTDGGPDVDPVDAVVPDGVLPDTIEVMSPGPGLAAAIAGVDRSGLPDGELVALARARVRLIAHEQALLMADLVAIADRCRPRFTQPRVGNMNLGTGPVDHAEEEIAAGLTWTQNAAARQLDLAETVVKQFPALHRAMCAGEVDWPKVKTIADGVRDLEPALARAVVEKALLRAPQQTTAALRARVSRLVIAADPTAAQRRYRKAVALRRWELALDEDGTASLHGRNLPVERALAADGRVQAIADWLIDRGDERSVDELRSDIALDLLQGLPVPGPDGQDAKPAPTDPPAGDPNPDPANPTSDSPGRASGKSGRRGVCPTCGLARLARGLELTAPLTTLLGLAQLPGSLGSWGPVLAEAVQDMLADLRSAPWRFAVTDDNGRLLWTGPVKRRPSAADATFVRTRDRRCRFPGCRRPASRTEIDHTKPHSHGGPSIPPNLACLCTRHHALKSAGLWHVSQGANGILKWTSHLGRGYITRPEPAHPTDDDP